MRWKESDAGDGAAPGHDVAGDEVIDAAFRLSGRWLPVDHALALQGAVVKILPWLDDEPDAGIHSIHGAASGNGWERPGNRPGELLNLSRRTPLVLRVPARRAGDVAALCGRRLDVGGHALTIGALQPRRGPCGAGPSHQTLTIRGRVATIAICRVPLDGSTPRHGDTGTVTGRDSSLSSAPGGARYGLAQPDITHYPPC